MKKLILLSIWSFTGTIAFAQVGVNTTNPDNSAALDVFSTTKGLLLPRLSSAQIRAISTPAAGLMVYRTDSLPGTLLYSSGKWAATAQKEPGDIKQGFQANDHSGWIKLDGRALSTLTATQQAAATLLGITGNLPDARDAYMASTAAGTALGTISSSNSVTLALANLPNYAINTSHSHAYADHAHSMSVKYMEAATGTGATGYAFMTNSNPAYSTVSTGYTNGGSNLSTYTGGGSYSINGGVTQTALSIKPKTMTVNTFIYLGQ